MCLSLEHLVPRSFMESAPPHEVQHKVEPVSCPAPLVRDLAVQGSLHDVPHIVAGLESSVAGLLKHEVQVPVLLESDVFEWSVTVSPLLELEVQVPPVPLESDGLELSVAGLEQVVQVLPALLDSEGR